MVFILLADSHCHLDSFKDVPKKVLAAEKVGVERMVTNSTEPGNMAKNLELSKNFKSVECALGTHPSNALGLSKGELSNGFSFVEEHVSEAIGIGEIGMDFKHAKTIAERNLQGKVFRGFIKLAIENDKPVSVHARYAETQCLDILEEMRAEKVHMHWFTNSKKTTKRAVQLGYVISCGPIIFSDPVSAGIVKGIPLENLLLETDCPVPFAGKISEPSWIPGVAEKIAELHGETAKTVAIATGKNYKRVFGGKL